MNTVNIDAEKPCFTVVPADGQWQSSYTKVSWNDFKGDLYPGTTGNNEFSDNSTPASVIYSSTNGKLEKPVYGIRQDETVKTITFAYLDKNATGIENETTTETNITETAFGIDGRKVATGKNLQATLPKGIYVISSGQSSKKVFIK